MPCRRVRCAGRWETWHRKEGADLRPTRQGLGAAGWGVPGRGLFVVRLLVAGGGAGEGAGRAGHLWCPVNGDAVGVD